MSRFSVILLRSYIGFASYICLRQVILLTLFAVVVRSNTHFACSVGSYTSTHFFEDGIGGAAATTVASAKHQTRVRSCGCAVIFLHQRNEWHNEATSLNVRAPSVALPVGLCRMANGGNT